MLIITTLATEVQTDLQKLWPSSSHSLSLPLPSSVSVLVLPSVPTQSSGTRRTRLSKEQTKLLPGFSGGRSRRRRGGGGGRRLLEPNGGRTRRGREAATGNQATLRQTSAKNKHQQTGHSSASKKKNCSCLRVYWTLQFQPSFCFSCIVIVLSFAPFLRDTGPQWQNKAFYCCFSMKYSCKCTKY